MSAVVVAVAVVDRGGPIPRVLLGRRSRPPALAGLWEFPGGKVEPGERGVDALRRECREELGVEVILGDRLGKDLALPNGAVLRIWTAGLPPGAEPVPVEHSELCWASAEALDALDWIPADRPLIAELQLLLRA